MSATVAGMTEMDLNSESDRINLLSGRIDSEVQPNLIPDQIASTSHDGGVGEE